jgi:hypothetical protein
MLWVRSLVIGGHQIHGQGVVVGQVGVGGGIRSWDVGAAADRPQLGGGVTCSVPSGGQS